MQLLKRIVLSPVITIACASLALGSFGACSSSKKSKPAPAPAPVATANNNPQTGSSGINSGINTNRNVPVRVTYEAVAPIISANCGGGTCHGNGSRYGVLVGNQKNVDARRANIYQAVSSGEMPKGRSLTQQDGDKLLQYMDQ